MKKERPPRICKNCGTPFAWFGVQRHCSPKCREEWHDKQHRTKQMALFDQGRIHPSMQGPLSELIITQDLLASGWYVFRCIGAHSPFDLIAYKDGQCVKIEVKTGRRWPSGSTTKTRVSKFEHDVLATYLANTKEIIYEPPLPDLHLP